jgi:hypothetical protein
VSKTIRHRILDILVARLRNGLVADCILNAPDDITDPTEYIKPASVSGTYNAVKPRAFSVAVSAANTVTITDETLWAESGPEHPVIAPVTQAYVAGTPFELGVTGIFFTITHNITDSEGTPLSITSASLIGKSWNVRIAKASETIRSLAAYRSEWGQDEPFPRLAVFPAPEEPVSGGVIESSTKRLQINLLLDIRFETNNTGRIEELFGDVLNEMLRDVNLYDNSNCLATNLEYLGSTPFEANNLEEVSFAISFEITYRNKLTDTRVIQ